MAKKLVFSLSLSTVSTWLKINFPGDQFLTGGVVVLLYRVVVSSFIVVLLLFLS